MNLAEKDRPIFYQKSMTHLCALLRARYQNGIYTLLLDFRCKKGASRESPPPLSSSPDLNIKELICISFGIKWTHE